MKMQIWGGLCKLLEADLLYQATLNATSKILGQSLLNFYLIKEELGC